MAEKDPAFLLYSKDWLQGTAGLFPAEKGVFMDLLCHQHQDGYLPNSTKRLAKMAALSEIEFLEIWEGLKHKFFEKDGKLYNKKLISIIEDRAEHGEMRSVVGTFGQLLKTTNCSEPEKANIRRKFNFRDFIGEDKANLSKCLSKFISTCLANGSPKHGNEDGDGIEDGIKDNKGSAEGNKNIAPIAKFLIPEMLSVFTKSRQTYSPDMDRDYKPLNSISEFIHKQSKLNGNHVENKGIIIKKWEQLCSTIEDDNFYKTKSLSVISNQIQEIYQIQQHGRPEITKRNNAGTGRHESTGTGGY